MNNLHLVEENNVDEKSFDSKRIKKNKRILKKKIHRLKVKTARLIAILVIFALLAGAALLGTLVVLNHASIVKALGNIPGAIANFPIDWLIAGAIGAGLGFLTYSIFLKILLKKSRIH